METSSDPFPAQDAIPVGYGPEGIAVRFGEKEESVAWARLRAVAVAGVRGLTAKPVVVIDLLIDGGGTERPLSLIRLRSDRFDPRKLAPNAEDPMAALRAMIKGLLVRGEAIALPDEAAAACRPVRMYESLAAYEDAVLTLAGRDLA